MIRASAMIIEVGGLPLTLDKMSNKCVDLSLRQKAGGF